jgi:hypothetical protein
MADRELKANERNFCRHAGKMIAQIAREHGVKLQDSDVDMIRRSITETVKWRLNQNEQAAAQGHIEGDSNPE